MGARCRWFKSSRPDHFPSFRTLVNLANADRSSADNSLTIGSVPTLLGLHSFTQSERYGSAGLNWSKEGWFVPVDYCILNNPIRPKDHAAILRPFLPAKYSPLQESGDGLQSVYLAEVPRVPRRCPYRPDRPSLLGCVLDDRHASSRS